MTGPSEEASELIEQVFRLAREKAAALAEVDRLTAALAQAEHTIGDLKGGGAYLDEVAALTSINEQVEADLRVLREGIKALADHHHDDWANTHCTCDLRALLGESS